MTSGRHPQAIASRIERPWKSCSLVEMTSCDDKIKRGFIDIEIDTRPRERITTKPPTEVARWQCMDGKRVIAQGIHHALSPITVAQSKSIVGGQQQHVHSHLQLSEGVSMVPCRHRCDNSVYDNGSQTCRIDPYVCHNM